MSLDPNGGALAVFAPTGLSQHYAAENLGEQLLDQALTGSATRLGDALIESYRRTTANPVDLNTYLLLGDPALALSQVDPPEVLFQEDFETGVLP